MSKPNSKKPPVGRMLSFDLTIPNADDVLAFYQAVIGWDVQAMAMQDAQGAYTDHILKDQEGNWLGGICHLRGVNADLPPVWLLYIQVANIEQSLEQCLAAGGQVLKRAYSEDGVLEYAVIKDPAGAILGLTPVSS